MKATITIYVERSAAAPLRVEVTYQGADMGTRVPLAVNAGPLRLSPTLIATTLEAVKYCLEEFGGRVVE